MSQPRVPDQEFIELWKKYKSAAKIAKILNISERRIMSRRRRIEKRYDIALDSINNLKVPAKYKNISAAQKNSASINLGIEDGTIIVFSDAHFWPGIETTAYRGLLHLIEKLSPKAVICNGDAFDGSHASRYAPIKWENTPSIIQELRACEIALGQIEQAALKARYNAKLIWTIGNHDARFESRIAHVAPEYRDVFGTRLTDHFPTWEFCWACWPTNDLIVKHRWKSGIHATHNNTINSGKSMVTGHLHSLKVTPWTDYNGTRFGVDTGTLAEPFGPQFEYTELNPVNWRSGFIVLTIKDGDLLWPEVVRKYDDDRIEFRGELHTV